MSSSQNNTTENKKSKLNIGVIVFLAIFIYMLANAAAYFTRPHIAFCEVQPGRIIDNDVFTGFVLRNEAVVKADTSGYVSYYINDADMAAKNSDVCIIDYTEQKKENTGIAEDYTLSTADYSDLKEYVTNFRKNYSDSDYQAVYSLQFQLNNMMSRIVSQTNIRQMNSNYKATNYKVMSTPECGVISHCVDNMEGYTVDSLTPELFTNKDYDKQQITAGTYVERNTPVYKIIYDDVWQIALYPNEEQLKKIKDYQTIDITFSRDNITTSADVEIKEVNGVSYIILTLKNYLSRYYGERYLDVEIMWHNYDGLKIPVSAITTKDFYMIPIDFYVSNEGTDEKGFYSKDNGETKFVKTVIYLKNDEYCYVDKSAFSPGQTLINMNNQSTFKIGSEAALKGVYNINKGYAVFKLINVLYEYGDYCIIDSTTDYGVSLYDHIILDGNSASENQIIYK